MRAIFDFPFSLYWDSGDRPERGLKKPEPNKVCQVIYAWWILRETNWMLQVILQLKPPKAVELSCSNCWIEESPAADGFSIVLMLAQVTPKLIWLWKVTLKIVKMQSGTCAVLRSIAALLGWARQSTTFLRLELASCHSHLTLCLCNMVANVSSTGKSLVLAFFFWNTRHLFFWLWKMPPVRSNFSWWEDQIPKDSERKIQLTCRRANDHERSFGILWSLPDCSWASSYVYCSKWDEIFN